MKKWKMPDELKGHESERDECIDILLNGIPKEGGRASREKLAQLVLAAFDGGFLAGNASSRGGRDE